MNLSPLWVLPLMRTGSCAISRKTGTKKSLLARGTLAAFGRPHHFFACMVTTFGSVSSSESSTPFSLCFVGVSVLLFDFFFFNGASSAFDDGLSSVQCLHLSTDTGIRILRLLVWSEVFINLFTLSRPQSQSVRVVLDGIKFSLANL
jgi:hypothetical protein